MKIISTAIVALAISTQAQAICTPATINPGAIQRIAPHMSLAAVEAILDCVPSEHTPGESGAILWTWRVPLYGSAVHVVVDAAGVVGAFYFSPGLLSYSSAMRVEPPLAPLWMPSAGAGPGVAP